MFFLVDGGATAQPRQAGGFELERTTALAIEGSPAGGNPAQVVGLGSRDEIAPEPVKKAFYDKGQEESALMATRSTPMKGRGTGKTAAKPSDWRIISRYFNWPPFARTVPFVCR